MVVGLSGPTMNDIGTIEYWRDHARELRGKLGKAADEIERLRGDNKALEEMRDSAMRLYGRAQRASFPELCQSNHQEIGHDDSADRCPLCRAIRGIEELERRLALAEKADCEYIGKHIITTEQIRAAVEVALTLERGISEHVPDEMKKIFERAAAAVWNALGKLGIGRRVGDDRRRG
jgi:hypothetical protein